MEEVTDEPLYRDRACGIDIGKAEMHVPRARSGRGTAFSGHGQWLSAVSSCAHRALYCFSALMSIVPYGSSRCHPWPETARTTPPATIPVSSHSWLRPSGN
jgi:hypothetical protein